MNTPYYEIYVQPENGPCSVQERGFDGEIAWTEKQPAIDTAIGKKKLYPNIDFIVHEIIGRNRTAAFRTIENK